MDSISWPQLHKGFNVSWKLCLNLCSLRWLKPSLSLVISLIPLGLRISKTEFGEGRMKLSIFSLKTEILLEFLRLRSKLFHSRIADGKKEFWKKLYYVIIKGILPSVLVAYGVHFTGMRWIRHFECSFLKININMRTPFWLEKIWSVTISFYRNKFILSKVQIEGVPYMVNFKCIKLPELWSRCMWLIPLIHLK